MAVKIAISTVSLREGINKERIIFINRSAVEITGEPFAYNSNLDFLIDEYLHSRKTKADFCRMVFRILSTHPFVQGNKRTAFALISKYGMKDATMAKNVLVEISTLPSMPTAEGVRKLSKVLSKRFAIHVRFR